MEKQYGHRNATIIHPDNRNDLLVVEVIGGRKAEVDLKDPQIRRYFKNGKLEFMVKSVRETTVSAR